MYLDINAGINTILAGFGALLAITLLVFIPTLLLMISVGDGNKNALIAFLIWITIELFVLGGIR